MKIELGKSSLVKELASIQATVEKKTTLPILTNVLIRTTESGIELIGTDLDTWFTTFVDARIIEPGQSCVPAKKLFEIIKAMPKSLIELTIDDKQAVIKCERSKIKLTTTGTVNFPDQPNPPVSTHSLDSATMSHFIERTNFAITTEESRYTLNGAKLELRKNSARMIATDGHRLAFIERTINYEGKDIDVLIPGKALSLLAKMLDASEPLEFAIFEGKIYFHIGKRTIISRMLTGNFPNYELVLPSEDRHEMTIINDRILAGLNRVQIVADQLSKSVRFEFGADQLKLASASAEVGEAGEEIEAKYTGEEMTIGLNAGYVQDYFAKMPANDETVIKVKAKDSAVEFTPRIDGGYKYRYIVMPVRVV